MYNLVCVWICMKVKFITKIWQVARKEIIVFWKYLHYLQQGIYNGFQWGQGHFLVFWGRHGEGAVAWSVAGSERTHCRRFHFTDPEQLVKLGQGKLCQAHFQDLHGGLWKLKPSTLSQTNVKINTNRMLSSCTKRQSNVHVHVGKVMYMYGCQLGTNKKRC